MFQAYLLPIIRRYSLYMYSGWYECIMLGFITKIMYCVCYSGWGVFFSIVEKILWTGSVLLVIDFPIQSQVFFGVEPFWLWKILFISPRKVKSVYLKLCMKYVNLKSKENTEENIIKWTYCFEVKVIVICFVFEIWSQYFFIGISLLIFSQHNKYNK
jgi:hypothetical protein